MMVIINRLNLMYRLKVEQRGRGQQRAKLRCAESCRSSCGKKIVIISLKRFAAETKRPCKTFCYGSSCQKRMCKTFGITNSQHYPDPAIDYHIHPCRPPGNIGRVGVWVVSIGRHRGSPNITRRVQVRHLKLTLSGIWACEHKKI